VRCRYERIAYSVYIFLREAEKRVPNGDLVNTTVLDATAKVALQPRSAVSRETGQVCPVSVS
jgi:hypothetical protein